MGEFKVNYFLFHRTHFYNIISDSDTYLFYKRKIYLNGSGCVYINPRVGPCILINYLCAMTTEHLKSMRDRVLVLGRFL